MHRLILTFDIEDFINPDSILALQVVLELLNKYGLKALFFITGHMAEKISNFPETLDMLKNHEIGFHSSGHSVRPIILEYTDTGSYQKAYLISQERETAHINPLTGKAEGEGGICFLQDLFNPRKIQAYRAPGMSWAPPHLEALVDLGIKFDFSSNISDSEPVLYKAITFYPYTFVQHWSGNLFDYHLFLSAIIRRKVAILDLHPSFYINCCMWDSIYYEGNPPAFQRIPKRPPKEISRLFFGFELLLQRIRLLDRLGLIEVEPRLTPSTKDLIMSEGDVQRYYAASIGWPREYFSYVPKFIWTHFQEFFDYKQG